MNPITEQSIAVEERRTSPGIYRYKLSDECVECVTYFAKMHEYDHRHDFKIAWSKWIEDNNHMVNKETDRLTALGYKGEVLSKMYKSSRYYFRNKKIKDKTQQERKQYIRLDKSFLKIIDTHIIDNISHDYQPKDGFLQFCSDNEQSVKDVMRTLLDQQGLNNNHEIIYKIKKTYKNRFFILTSKK